MLEWNKEDEDSRIMSLNHLLLLGSLDESNSMTAESHENGLSRGRSGSSSLLVPSNLEDVGLPQ